MHVGMDVRASPSALMQGSASGLGAGPSGRSHERL